jgi:hypothetical protein
MNPIVSAIFQTLLVAFSDIPTPDWMRESSTLAQFGASRYALRQARAKQSTGFVRRLACGYNPAFNSGSF